MRRGGVRIHTRDDVKLTYITLLTLCEIHGRIAENKANIFFFLQ